MTKASARDPEVPAFLRAVGHPLRWRLLGELARSDRMVHELTERVAQPQSLVSYHLARLRDVELVSARRSSADGRDSYYSVDLARIGSLLGATGAELHPGLHLERPSPARARVGASRSRVLFLCTGNSARSQIAEAFARERSGGAVEARSAGSSPKPLHPNAVRAMRDGHGIDISAQRSKHLDDLATERFDCVVTLCDRVREVCPDWPGAPEAVHWSIADPAVGHSSDRASLPGFRRTAVAIESRVGFLLAALAAPSDPVVVR